MAVGQSPDKACPLEPFPGRFADPAIGLSQRTHPKEPLCCMMKSLVSILWVMENYCFEQMAKTCYICKETAGSEWILEGETQVKI